MYIFEGLDKNHVMLTSLALPLHTWLAPRGVNPTFRTTPPGLQFLRKLGPHFEDTGPEIEPRFPAKPLRLEIGAQFGPRVGGIEPATFRLHACVLPTRPNSGGQHGHTSSFAIHGHRPQSRSDQIQNPNTKLAVWILDFGGRILDFRILDFGFSI